MSDPTHPRTIVAVTGEGDRYAAVRSRATALAAGAEATVILYDIDAAAPLESPLPTQWSADGERETFGDRLGPDDLDAAGRAALATQVRGLRSMGIDAWAWLPSTPDGADLAGYAEHQDADVILVPEELEHPGLLDRLRGAGADHTRETTPIPVMTVGGAGAAR